MRQLLTYTLLCGVLVGSALVGSPSVAGAQEAKPADKMEKITYTDHILPILRAKCAACHSADQAKGGLVVDSYTGLMAGGASGEVVAGGDVDGSRLYDLITHKAEPKMPPKEPKMPDDQLALFKKWIEGGALETLDSKAKIKKPAFTLGTAVISTGKPEGPPPMPEKLPTDPAIVSTRGNAVTAMAASPWAPLIAVSGHKQVLLYNTQELRLVGILPFPEGQPYVLKFSRNSSLLLAGGGRGGQSGRVVVWDVKTGARVFEVGNEYDAVMAADISADNSQIALGGPRKIVRVYSTKDGELMYEIKKHTDWVTALEFSPDGVLLATGDRSNGLFVWEAFTGREFYNLAGHQAAISSVSWRSDANILASSSEDTTIKLWEMGNGGMVKTWGAHGGGAAAVQFTRDGRLFSTGRDLVSKLWDQNGAQQRAFPALADLGLEVAFSSEDDRAFAGDWSGTIRSWNAKDGAELTALRTNPLPLAARIELAVKDGQALDAATARAVAVVAGVKKAQTDREAAAVTATAATTAAQTAAAAAVTEKTAADQALVTKVATLAAAETALTAAKTKVDAVTAEKAAADKAVVDAGADAAKKAEAEKVVVAKVAELQVAQTALTTATTARDTATTDKAAGDKLVADLVVKVKATADQAAALKLVSDKAVEVAKITPEYSKMLADSEAAAAAATAKSTAGKLLVDALNSEKGRVLAVPAPPAATPAPAPAAVAAPAAAK
ncbi:MAG: domain, G-beta repeat [Planctomycetaceae bacterium]|nr:domain, G-beta repeat [Planctomycetaceae bacterium]